MSISTHQAINVLRVDASARRTDSVSRHLTSELLAHIGNTASVNLVTRDLADGIEVIDEAWVGANFTPAEERTIEQHQKLAGSDELVAELKQADVLIIGSPIYNFGIPGALKLWIDLICRARLTFAYTSNGPEGLLTGKTAYVVLASGGVKAGSAADFATGYLRHVLGFVGIDDVRLVDASTLMQDADAVLSSARSDIVRIGVAA
jgi:FMN-dependent NADH-azoreductase